MNRPVCAIVGAGEGLGQALATRFAAEGFALALMSRTERVVVDDGRFFAVDATQPEAVEAAFARVDAEMGAPDVMIYNARGGFERVEPLEASYEVLEDTFRLEVVGALAAAKSTMPAMRARGCGSVIFSSATAAFRGSASHPLYAIGKFGLRALSQSLAKAYGRDGVHVAHVRLDCDLDTPIMQKLYGDAYDPAKLAKPEDVAEAYWRLHDQPKTAWTNELELRPHAETWTI